MPFRVFAQVPQTACRPACFSGLLAPNKDREIGGGRATLPHAAPPACRPVFFWGFLAQKKAGEIGGGGATRQPGQVRKEAALTRSGSGRSSVSYLFFRANRAKCGDLARIRFA